MAVIDMGSNSFRLVVFEFDRNGWWSLVDEIREPTRVSAGMGDSGALQLEPMNRALRTASVFANFLEASGVDHVDAVATSAIRDAANRDELLGRVRDRTGLEVRTISGAEEAWYGYLAIANSTTVSDGFGIDIGGGSVQLMRLADRRLEKAESVRLGAVRVSESHLPDEEVTPKQLKALRKHVARTLGDLDWWASRGRADGDGTARLAGLGGTVRNLAAAAQKRMDLTDLDVQGFCLHRDALGELIDQLAARPAARRGSVRGIKPDRGDVILGGAVVLDTAMEVGGFDAVEVTEAGLREGILFSRMLGDREVPLLDDVRRASVENLEHRYGGDHVHAAHVAHLSLQVFDALGHAGLHSLGPPERDVLWAACLLHDIGTAINYDDHHRHSHYLILNSGLPGWSPRELELIALVARWHRKGEPDASQLGDLERKGDARRLRLLCGVIRLAEQLERSRDQAVASVEFTRAKKGVRLAAATNGSGADPSVAVWAAQRSSDLLAEAIGERVEVARADD